VRTAGPVPILLKDGTLLNGTLEGTKDGHLMVKPDTLAEPAAVAFIDVTAVNPPRRGINFIGNFGIGLSVADGNTNTKSASLFGEFIARAEKQRMTVRGAYNYAENENELSARNGKASIKYDYFLTKRFYAYGSASFEHDTFQDLDLRTALSIGPGWQIFDKGDFTEEWLRELQWYVEAGVAYINEDRDDAEDESYIGGRWSTRVDWPFVPKRVTFFHFQEGLVGFEDFDDVNIYTETGFRFAIWNNFVATAQVNWRWDNTPSPGFERDDTLYLLSLGYSFDTW
jgi:putative salt-induced outer membrane protein YdiY